MLKAVLKAFLYTGLIFGGILALPHRPIDPDAVRQQSGNTVLYDHEDTCWSGFEPAHVKVPGHVIIRIEGGIRGGHWFYGGPNYVRIALADVFTHDNPHVYVRAFCE